MYDNIRRERLLRMQAGQSLQGAGSRSRTIIITAVVLFAMAGLLSGFAVGAFTHPHKTTSAPTPNAGPTVIAQQSASPTPTATQSPVALGYPVINTITQVEAANGTTPYTLTIQVVDQSIDKAHGKPVHAPGITCKIWLTKDGDVSGNIRSNQDRLTSNNPLQALQAPFPGEEPNSLVFSTTQQTQTCNADGQGTWSYSVAPTVKHGTYFIVVLVDWAGAHYNWSWQEVTIQKGN